MRLILLSGVLAAGFCVCPALAGDCPGNPDALGTSRTIVVDPAKTPRIGSMSYPQSLPLEPKEVVLTFDDGPLPRYTAPVLETLAHECVKATFFIIGEMARAYPDWVQREARAGHTIGNHTETHPHYIDKISQERGVAEIDIGARHIAEALAPTGIKMAPFFRFPGFRHTEALDEYVNKQGYVAIGADFPADDWTFIGPETVLKRAMDRLEKRGSGILLLHDIHQRTATILPKLLRELKARGYKVVQMVPAGGVTLVAAMPAPPAPPAEAASKEPGAKEAAPLEVAMKAAPMQTASKAPGTNELVPKEATTMAAPMEAASKVASSRQAALKLKETPAKETAAKEPDAKQLQAAAAPRHRHTASLRYAHHPTRQAAVKTSTRSMRDSPD
jgi:peptidoglycan/xylan/chitin deacetylase (PgdA/CDA1 family)